LAKRKPVFFSAEKMALFWWQYFFSLGGGEIFFQHFFFDDKKKFEFTKSLNKRNNVLKFWLVLWKVWKSFLVFLSSSFHEFLVLMSVSLMLNN